MKTIIKKVHSKILRKLDQIPFFSYISDLSYQAAIEKHIDNLPIISSDDLNIVEALNTTGVFVTSLAKLSIPSTSQMLQSAQNLMPEIPSICGKENEYTIHATSEQMMEHLEIFFWGLQQRLLNIVENYLGLPIAYHGAYFRRDIVNQVQTRSRLWHIDKEDRKMLKIIVYLNDVNDDGGPFQYIPQAVTSKVAQSLRYNDGYIQEKTMQQVISPLNWESCTGLSGTVVFADTANIFHRGKIPTASDRFAIFFDYTYRQPKYQSYYKSSLSDQDLAIVAEKLSEDQKRCLLWK
jgi:hypothetical protein